MVEWGAAVRRVKRTDRRLVKRDRAVNYLSYFTDNGAFYYGDAWGEAGGGGAVCNEDALTAVAAGLKAQALPVRAYQPDDWWYPGGQAVYVHCIRNWTLGRPAFSVPSLGALSARLGAPLLLYAPFFCAKRTGGNVYTEFRMVESIDGPSQFAQPHPADAERFYSALFECGAANGMVGYENDFMNYNLLAVPHFRRVFNESTRWMAGVDAAAAVRGIPIQLCMTLPSDLMQTLELVVVTNYRASTDYAAAHNFDIGGSSLLGWALGLRPSKDNFWTHRPASAVATGRPRS